MAVHRFQLRKLDARKRQELMPYPLEVLGDDVKPRMRQQVVNVGDATRRRVLDRDHGELGAAGFDRGDRILEGGTGERLQARIGVERREMRVGAGLALEGDSV